VGKISTQKAKIVEKLRHKRPNEQPPAPFIGNLKRDLNTSMPESITESRIERMSESEASNSDADDNISIDMPLLFSNFNTSGERGTKTAFRVLGSRLWSKDLDLSSIGHTTLKILHHDNAVPLMFNVCVSVEEMSGKFAPTRLIKLSPQFVVVNNSSIALQYRQSAVDSQIFNVNSNVSQPFHCLMNFDVYRLQVRNSGSINHVVLHNYFFVPSPFFF
jgi:hypothetical protein